MDPSSPFAGVICFQANSPAGIWWNRIVLQLWCLCSCDASALPRLWVLRWPHNMASQWNMWEHQVNILSVQFLGYPAWSHRHSRLRGLSYSLLFTATFHEPTTAPKIIIVYFEDNDPTTAATRASLVSAGPLARETAPLRGSRIPEKPWIDHFHHLLAGGFWTRWYASVLLNL